MSRLDDELRVALRREEPSADFQQRVLRAVAAAPPEVRSWWDELVALFTSPTGRWITVGVAASLLVLLVAGRLFRSEPADTTRANVPRTQETGAGPDPLSKDTVTNGNPKVGTADREDTPLSSNHGVARRRSPHRSGLYRQATKPDDALSEGEAATNKLLLALHIASESLNEAQRIVTAED